MGRLPNVVELARKPDKPRYIWIAIWGKGEGGSIESVGMTWTHLDTILKQNRIKRLLVVDFHLAKTYEISEEFRDFMDQWRANYFDPKWSYGETLSDEKT